MTIGLKRIKDFGVSETSKDKRVIMIAYEPAYLEKILSLLNHKNFYNVKMNSTYGEIFFNENGEIVRKFTFPLNLYQFIIKLCNSIKND